MPERPPSSIHHWLNPGRRTRTKASGPFTSVLTFAFTTARRSTRARCARRWSASLHPRACAATRRYWAASSSRSTRSQCPIPEPPSSISAVRKCCSNRRWRPHSAPPSSTRRSRNRTKSMATGDMAGRRPTAQVWEPDRIQATSSETGDSTELTRFEGYWGGWDGDHSIRSCSG